jgi:hypothetical protein
MTINFGTDRKTYEVIIKIARRAVAMAADAGEDYKQQDAVMDITAVHLNDCPLRLEALSEADNFNFAHDVFGIRRHLNRETGKLENFFSPRFSA